MIHKFWDSHSPHGSVIDETLNTTLKGQNISLHMKKYSKVWLRREILRDDSNCYHEINILSACVEQRISQSALFDRAHLKKALKIKNRGLIQAHLSIRIKHV